MSIAIGGHSHAAQGATQGVGGAAHATSAAPSHASGAAHAPQQGGHAQHLGQAATISTGHHKA
jgi:hypothetical protein